MCGKVDVWELRVKVAFLSDNVIVVCEWAWGWVWEWEWGWECGRVDGEECGRVFRIERCEPLRVREFICGVPGPQWRRRAFL